MTQQASFTLADLIEVMRACAGETESADLDGDIAEKSFAELGYDSLAVLELAVRIRSRFGLSIPDDVAGTLHTPGAVVAYLTEHTI